MKFHAFMAAAATVLIAPSALAQTAPATPAPAPSPSASASASAGTAVSTAPVTDAEVSQFATAALAVATINADTTIAQADKNPKLVEAIRATGLTAVRFNEIGQAMQADPALNKRVQDEAAKQQPAPEAAPAQ